MILLMAELAQTVAKVFHVATWPRAFHSFCIFLCIVHLKLLLLLITLSVIMNHIIL